MKLPEIEYGPVQGSAAALGQVGEAARGLSDTVAKGLQAFGQELIKTQTQRAAADVRAGLVKLEEELNARRYIPEEEARQRLGDAFDALPGHQRAQRTVVKDPATGQDVAVLPTWVVAGALYDAHSKELVQKASEGITGPGWQASFQDAARAEIAGESHRFRTAQLTAMLEDQKAQQRGTVQQYVRLGAHDRALDTIEQSDAFSQGEKALLREQVLKDQGDENLIAAAEQKATELEQKHQADPKGAMEEALALGGKLGPKVAQRLHERDQLRTEAQNDQVRGVKDHLELGIRSAQVRTLDQLERLPAYKALPDGPKADLVQILNGENERRARLAQLTSEKEWQQELSRFQGLSDREKVQQWPTYATKLPAAYQGNFAQVYEAARVRLSNAWDSEDVQKTFDLAGRAVGNKGLGAAAASRPRDMGRRWYDAETQRQKGVPPTQAEAALWLAEKLQYGDENGDDWFGGNARFRFEAELAAEKAGEPVRFQPYVESEQQKYPPSALLLRQGGAGGQVAPAASPAAPAPAAPPAAPPARPPGVPPAAIHITNGRRGGWLLPGNPMPAGWKEG
jgi:hypothetical protein